MWFDKEASTGVCVCTRARVCVCVMDSRLRCVTLLTLALGTVCQLSPSLLVFSFFATTKQITQPTTAAAAAAAAAGVGARRAVQHLSLLWCKAAWCGVAVLVSLVTCVCLRVSTRGVQSKPGMQRGMPSVAPFAV